MFIELVRRGLKPGQDLFYYITKSGYEVDFLVVNQDHSIELVQVSYDIGAQKTKERELRALCEAAQELQAKRLTVITMNMEAKETLAGNQIDIVPAIRWFMGG